MMWDLAPWSQWLWMAATWIIAVAAIVWAVTALFPTEPHRDPQQILDERFARGDLDLDEYRQGSDELQTHTRRSDRTRA